MWELGTISRPCFGPWWCRRWAKEAFLWVHLEKTHSRHSRPAAAQWWPNSLAQNRTWLSTNSSSHFFAWWMKNPQPAGKHSPFHPPCQTCFSCFEDKQTFFLSVKPMGSLLVCSSSWCVAFVFALGLMRGREPAVQFNRSSAKLRAWCQWRPNERGTTQDDWEQKQWIRNCLTLSGYENHTVFFCYWQLLKKSCATFKLQRLPEKYCSYKNARQAFH